jgi:hypothetical protein
VTIERGVALLLAVFLLGLAALVGRGLWVAAHQPAPPPVACPPPAAPPTDLDELAQLLDLAHATSLPARLACSLPADDDEAAGCGVALSRAEAGLALAESAVRVGAVAVARQQLPAVRAIVLSRGLPAPAVSR